MPHRFEPPGVRRIAVSAPDLSGNEEAYLVEAVRSGWVRQAVGDETSRNL
jgi:dTDP-4-amino-4,6-dideoxygalactose transaminase